MNQQPPVSNEQYPITRRDALKSIGFTAGAFAAGIPLTSGATASTHTQTMTVRSDTSSVVTGYRAGDDASSFPATTPNVTADLTWVHPLWSGTTHSFDPTTQWIWHSDRDSSTDQEIDNQQTYYVREPVAGDVVELADSFSIPGQPMSGTLYITADNGYEVWINGTHVGGAQVFDANGTDWEDSDLGQPFVNAQSGSWISVEDFDVSSLLSSRSNTLTVVGANEQQSTADGEQNGTVTSNPGGVIYELDVEYETCTSCTSDQLAKYEFACVETVDDECVTWDFVLEGDGDTGIGYTPGSYVSKADEAFEPMAVTFETEYCELSALVKSGRELAVQSFEDVDGSVEVTANDGKHAISFVEFYCGSDAAAEVKEAWSGRRKGGP